MIRPMYENAPGTYDLVYHTAKHFLGEDESPAWDRVPRGTLGAGEARDVATRDGLRPPPTGEEVDPAWWWPPWLQLARDAHARGYRPRYELLVHLAGDPAGARWRAAARDRRITEYVGCRLVVEPAGEAWQVVTAFFSPSFPGYRRLRQLAPALRAFAARKKDCPPDAPPRVPGPETKP